MSSKRMRLKESLKHAYEHKKSLNNAQLSSDGRKPESPVPDFTEEEKTFWANNNIFSDTDDDIIETSMTEDRTTSLNSDENQTLKIKDQDQDSLLNNEVIPTLQPPLNEEQHQNPSVPTNVDQNENTMITDHNDPLLSSNGPNSCIALLINLSRKDSVPPSPSFLSNNDPCSSIPPLPDIDVINSIPHSPFITDTTITSATSTLNPSSPQNQIEATLSRSRKRIDRIKRHPGKGRTLNKDEWKDTIRKRNRNSGQPYLSRNGTERLGRELKPFCNKCQFKCPTKFQDVVRKDIFDSFWNLKNNVRQWDFISKYCKKITKRSRTTETASRRKNTIVYSLPLPDVSVDPVPVCKVMFLNTLGIGAGMVATALKKVETRGIITPDARGGWINHKQVIDAEMIQSVCDHVRNFQPVESHYVRSRTSKLYLDESLSYTRMFALYNEWIDDSNCSNPARTLSQYQDIVNKHFNLGFHIPRKDHCDICHVHKNLPKPISETESKKYNDHMLNKKIARELKIKFKKLSETDTAKKLTTTYDFQKIHGMPHGQTSILYYKRKLSVYNLTFYSLGQKEGTCYVWDETVAKKGATEVATCIYNYIKEHCQKGINNFYFFSDNCGGQNRNRIVFLAYLQAAKDFNVTILHTFLGRGHTQNEGDSVHALIERFAKNKRIYTPDDWYNMIRWCKQDGNPYRVIEMRTDQFIDFKRFLSGPNWNVNTNGEKMFWSQIRQLLVLPNETDRIYYKTDFCRHNYDCIILYTLRQLNTRRRRKDVGSEVENSLSKAYSNKFTVPKSKLQDLKYLCEHQIIPEKYHHFYQALVPGDDEVDETTED